MDHQKSSALNKTAPRLDENQKNTISNSFMKIQLNFDVILI